MTTADLMAASRVDAAWAVLHTVLDPEVPAVSVCDLGIVRDVIEHDDGLEIVLTPTYSGCPATEAIEHDVLAAIEQAGLGPARADLREPWLREMTPLLHAARLEAPADKPFRSTGTVGRHSEHMGYILAEMQHLQRAFPGAVW